jgi:hypothetical protein
MKLPAENSHNLSLLDSESADYLENARQINSGGMNQRVRQEGVFQPIILRQWDDGTRSVYDGHHRLIAAYDNHPDFRVPVFVWEERGKLEDEFSSMSKHLAGKHDQSSHGKGGGMGAPRDTAHAKQKQAWELHEQGKTWEEVAKEAGYANGGAARLAGKAHEKRMKAKDDGSEVPKPDDVITPKPKPTTDKQGAKEIARAQAIVDKATGGRPVAEVLAEERAKAGSSKDPTAKELEITEAVIQSGGILRGEVERRRVLAGKEAVDLAKSDLEVLRKDHEFTQKRVDEVKGQRAEVRKAIEDEVVKSPEFEADLNERLDKFRLRSKTDAVDAFIESDRSSALQDMRDFADIYQRGMPYQQRDAWVADRAKQRFPKDKKAQKEYIDAVSESMWSMGSAERKLVERDEKVSKLSIEDKSRAKKEAEAYQDLYSLNKAISEREQIIRNGGVTSEQNAEIVRSVLIDSGRTMTDKPGQKLAGTKPVVAELRTELVKIPDELWDDQKFPNMNVQAVKSGRGHWSPYEQRVKTDGAKGSGRRSSTMLHEATHAVEDMNPQITQLQFVMSHRRAKGQKPEKLSQLVKGSGYKAYEVAIEDAWSSPYSGKIYGGSRRSNWEIMTMGIESLYKRGSYPSNLADEDHLNFVMGVLAHA